MRKLILQHAKAPGDVLVMTALVRDIALTHPNQFQVYVDTTAKELWRHNPYASLCLKNQVQQDIEMFRLDYGPTLNTVSTKNRHFLCGFYDNFERQTGIQVPLLYPWPDYHLSDEERDVPLVSGRYWVIISGGKTDFITKHWIYKRSQQLVNVLRGMDLRFVQVGAVGQGQAISHFHPRLENTLNLVGLSTLRDVGRLIYHAEGVICPVTFAMHLTAALHKPCVVIAGGREEWWWEAYARNLGNFGTELREQVRVPHRFLHTIGQLDCCQRHGCWLNTVVGPDRACRHPVAVGGQIAPKCMQMIKLEHVVEAVMSYYEDGTLPPIGQPKPIVMVNGKPHILQRGESMPLGPRSALEEALLLPEPQLIVETAAMTKIRA